MKQCDIETLREHRTSLKEKARFSGIVIIIITVVIVVINYMLVSDQSVM